MTALWVEATKGLREEQEAGKCFLVQLERELPTEEFLTKFPYLHSSTHTAL